MGKQIRGGLLVSKAITDPEANLRVHDSGFRLYEILEIGEGALLDFNLTKVFFNFIPWHLATFDDGRGRLRRVGAARTLGRGLLRRERLQAGRRLRLQHFLVQRGFRVVRESSHAARAFLPTREIVQ